MAVGVSGNPEGKLLGKMLLDVFIDNLDDGAVHSQQVHGQYHIGGWLIYGEYVSYIKEPRQVRKRG